MTPPTDDPELPDDTIAPAHLEEIQGLVFAGWGRRFPLAAYLFVRLAPGGARAWLDRIRAQVAWADGLAPGELDGLAAGAPRRDVRVQVALGPGGLAALDVPAEVIDRFPQELKLGMRRRARILGDRVDRAGDPVDWTLAVDAADALVLLFATDEQELAALIDEHRALARAHGGAEVALERSARWRAHEPFGFADGVSQPVVRGRPPTRAARAPYDEIPAGEIVLGYRNGYGRMPQSPTWDGIDLGRFGTYLVFRKLEQDVAGFWRYFRARAGELAGRPPVPADPARATEWLAARAMGRWMNGAPLVAWPDAPPPAPPPAEELNHFLYLDTDPDGVRCPIGSHVRRANPRDARGGRLDESITVSNRHRLLRRGRAYGEVLEPEALRRGDAPAAPSGLLFVSLQASIARGFEFVQQIWLANPAFNGAFREPDPIVGPGGAPITIPADPVRLRLPPAPRFVTPRGGGYFFVPSRAALARLAA